MSHSGVQLSKLTDLQQQISSANSVESLAELVASFLKGELSLDSAELQTIPPMGKTAVHTGLLGQTGYWLHLHRLESPLSEEEKALCDMVLSMATGRLELLTAVPTYAQKHLIMRLNQAIAKQQRLAVTKAIFAEEFSNAFPEAGAIFYMLNTSGRQLVVQTVLGHSQHELDLSPLPLEGVVANVMKSGETEQVIDQFGTSLWMPIKVSERPEGLLKVMYPGDVLLFPRDLTVLEQVAHYIGVVVNNERLVEQSWLRMNQLETIYNITMLTREKRPLTELLVEINEKLHYAFNVPTCYISLYDANTQTLSFPAFIRNHEQYEQEPVSILDDKSLVAWAVANKRSFSTENWLTGAKPVLGINVVDKTRSLVIVPMHVEGDVIGAISIQSFQEAAFDSSTLQTLLIIADHVAVLVKNARLHERTVSLVERESNDYQVAVALRQAIAVISASLDRKLILSHLLTALGNVIQYDTAHAFLWDEDGLRLMASRDFYDRPLSVEPATVEYAWQENALLHKVISGKKSLHLEQPTTHSAWPVVLKETAVASWMAIPLIAGGEIIGVMMAESTKNNAFGKQEEWLASSLCAHAAVALQNATLYKKTQQQLSELSTLYQASATMTANLDQDFVLQTVAKEMLRALNVDTCTIFVWDEQKQQLKTAAHRNQVIGENALPPEEQERLVGLGRLDKLSTFPPVRRALKNREILSLRHDRLASEDEKQLLAAANMQTILLVPLVRRERLLGLIALGQVKEPRTFTASALRLTQDLAGQAAVAIEHAYLFSQAQRRIEELATFHNIVLQLNTPLKLSAVLDAITESALKLIDANNLHIFLYDAERDRFTFGSALWDDGRREPAVPSLRPEGLTATVVRQGRPIVINNAKKHPLYNSGKAAQWGIHAIAGFPLKYGDQVIGAFTITYLRPHTFTKDELLLLNLLADQASVAVRNARLFAESQRRLMDMSALVDMAKQITGKLQLEEVLQTTVRILRDLLKARASTITMLSEDKTELVVKAADGANPKYVLQARMKLGEGISGRVVKRCEMVYIRDAHAEPDFLFFDDVVRSLLAVPLVVRDEAIGTLTIDSDQPNAFSESDIQLMTIAAAQVSVAISNARLFEEVERRAKELEIAYDELKESDRLKDELVQNVSHELRTPLTFVKGYVDLLMDGEMGLLTQQQQDALQIVSDKTDEITRIIEDIITLQRIDATNIQLERVSMSAFLDTAVSDHRLVASKKGLQIVYQKPRAKAMVHIDKQRMMQVMDNLLGNAMKFSPDGGTITVKLEEDDQFVTVCVSDEGIGVPKDKQDRIFDRFYQVDGSSRRRFGGTGIGLAIVKRIINAHHGRIWLESEVGKGSSFYFALPVSLPQIDVSQAQDPTAVAEN
ncbi:MAG: hypothetical protein Kow0080_04780 [Candidatus Promineifilaceae bacterium]